MSGIDYAALAEDAAASIAEAGRAITVRRYSRTVDKVTGTGTGTPQEGTLTCLVLPASQGTIQAFDNRLEGGTLVDEKLRFILAAAHGAPFEPQSNDELEFDGATWRILGCTPLNPAGTPLLYRIGAMRK